MAESLTHEGPLDTLESAVAQLRQAGFGTLVLHWTGSIPFALATLMYLGQVTNPRTSDLTCALSSLALALALLWMNCWRAVFAGTLRRQLTGEPSAPRTGGELSRLIAVQAMACSTKLLVLPFSLLIVFPFPAVVAFYRNVTTLADRQYRDPRATLARARHLASAQAGQSVIIFLLLIFLWLVVALNLAVLIGALPQLVRILTGYESTFSRSGFFFVTNSTFLQLVLAATWVVFDPFIQSVYCLRCYQAEARETGEDIRAGIRRLRTRIEVPALLLLLAAVALTVTPQAVAAPSNIPPAELEKASNLALHAPEYDWRLPPPPAPVRDKPWIVTVTDRIVASMRSITNALGKLVDRFFSWLGDKLGGSAQQQNGVLPVRGLHWTVYALLALAVLTCLVIAARMLQSRRTKPPEVLPGEGIASIRLDEENLTADRLPEEQWLELAERALSEQNLRLALRALYLACLAWMGRAEFISIHAGKTNREYELELKRRKRAVPEARELFKANVAAFERAWYGLHEVVTEDIGQFRERVAQMKATLPARRPAA